VRRGIAILADEINTLYQTKSNQAIPHPA